MTCLCFTGIATPPKPKAVKTQPRTPAAEAPAAKKVSFPGATQHCITVILSGGGEAADQSRTGWASRNSDELTVCLFYHQGQEEWKRQQQRTSQDKGDLPAAGAQKRQGWSIESSEVRPATKISALKLSWCFRKKCYREERANYLMSKIFKLCCVWGLMARYLYSYSKSVDWFKDFYQLITDFGSISLKPPIFC